MREGTTVGKTADGVTSERHRVNELQKYLHASFDRSCVNCLHAHFVLVLHEQTCVAATRLIWTAMMVPIKSYGGQKGGFSEPLEPPCLYGPE